MKRAITGGTGRGPVAHSRQRRTIRFMQGLLVAIAAALAGYAVVSFVNVLDFEPGREVDAGAAPSLMQPAALALGAVVAASVAVLLGGRDGVRLPTPARLEELAGRAEEAAVERARALAGDGDPSAPGRRAPEQPA